LSCSFAFAVICCVVWFRTNEMMMITAAPSILPFQLPIAPDQPQVRVSENKPDPNVTLTLILTLALVTVLTPTSHAVT